VRASWQNGVPATRENGKKELGMLLAEPGSCAAVQPLAVLFADVAHARRSAAAELRELSALHMLEPAVLPGLRLAVAATELLRCSVLLEADAHARLPPTSFATLRSCVRRSPR
jgi:hypothetical protein